MALDTMLPRRRRLEVTRQLFLRLSILSALSLYVIVVSGAIVRLTSSGLGCESWPGCEEGGFFPAADHHAYVEFGNRAISLFPLVLTLVVAVAAWRAPGLPRWTRWLATATGLGTLAQAPLGFVTIYFDLHPLLVLSHFLLALLVLAGGVVVALEAWSLEEGRAAPRSPRWLRRASLVLAAAALVLVVTGTLATAAGPHSGGAEIDRLGNLLDAVRLHVRATAVFGVIFAALLVHLVRDRRAQPGIVRVAFALLGLLLAQMIVGEVQWRTQLPWGVVLAHVALAAAIWVATVVLVHALWRPPKPLIRLAASGAAVD